ncbi:MAG: hypothetical protein ACLTOM_12805 [Roseburia sp.]
MTSEVGTMALQQELMQKEFPKELLEQARMKKSMKIMIQKKLQKWPKETL